MIIVEGPDGAGKSTLVRRIVDEFKLPEGERGTKDRSKLYEVTVPDTFRALTAGVDLDQPCYVWDRLFYSEFVYAPLGMPARKPMFNADQKVHIERIIETLRAPLILCLPPFEEVLRNMQDEREQMGGVREHINSIYFAYERMAESGELPDHTIVYDYTAGDVDDTWEQIAADIQDYIDFREMGSYS